MSSPAQEPWRDHLGRKVSVRFRVHDDPEHPWSEAVGVIQAVFDPGTDDARLSIVSRRGDIREIRVENVVAYKLFPV